MEAKESEASILGLMLMEPDCVPLVFSKLKTKDFSEEAHQAVFEAFDGLMTEGMTPDLPSVIQVLRNANVYETVGGDDFFKNLVDSVDNLETIDTHIKLVKDASHRRLSIAKLEASIESLKSQENDVADVWSGIYDTGLEVSNFSTSGSLHVETGHAERGLLPVRLQILKDRETAKVLYTGWNELDDTIPTGFALQDLSILASRPGMGKSSFKFCLIRRLCDRGFGVASCSTEQTKETETDRQDSILTGIPLHDIVKSNTWLPSDKRVGMIRQANEYMDQNWNYDILFSRQMDMARLREWLTLITRTRQKHILFIDLFDRFIDVAVDANKSARVTQKLSELAVLAQLFNIHICLCVQINRSVERRADRRPRLSDLKDAGGYEELGRLVMLLYRDAYYNEDSMDSTLELCVAKQNQGPAGPHVIVPFDFNSDTLESTPQQGGFFGQGSSDN